MFMWCLCGVYVVLVLVAQSVGALPNRDFGRS
jgi:hypothetical protein